MIRFLYSAAAAILLTITFISCNQDPTSVGANLISEQDKFSFQQYDSELSDAKQSTNYYTHKPKLGVSEYVLLGKTPYSESSIMFRYKIELPDTTLTRINAGEVIIRDAWMEMIPRYTAGEKSAPFDFTVHQVKSGWTAPGFDRDSISALQYDSRNIKSNLAVTDTTVSFHIDPAVVKDWLMIKFNNTLKNNGILLKPTANTQKTVGFLAVQAGSSYYDTYMRLVLERPSYYKDTVVVPPDEDIHFMTSTLPSGGTELYLQGGYSLRGFLYFDVSSIPKNSIINKAVLELTADVTKEFDGSMKSDSIFVQVFSDSTNRKLVDSSAYTILKRTGNVFSGDLSWAVQKWTTGTENQGLGFSLYDEYYSAARIVFYGSKYQDKALRPKLKIIYMQKK